MAGTLRELRYQRVHLKLDSDANEDAKKIGRAPYITRCTQEAQMHEAFHRFRQDMELRGRKPEEMRPSATAVPSIKPPSPQYPTPPSPSSRMPSRRRTFTRKVVQASSPRANARPVMTEPPEPLRSTPEERDRRRSNGPNELLNLLQFIPGAESNSEASSLASSVASKVELFGTQNSMSVAAGESVFGRSLTCDEEQSPTLISVSLPGKWEPSPQTMRHSRVLARASNAAPGNATPEPLLESLNQFPLTSDYGSFVSVGASSCASTVDDLCHSPSMRGDTTKLHSLRHITQKTPSGLSYVPTDLKPKPHNLADFFPQHLQMYCLSYALATLFPLRGPRSRDHHRYLRDAVIENAATAAASAPLKAALMSERHLTHCADQVKHLLRDLIADTTRPDSGLDVSVVCDAAGKPGNEDRVFVIPDVFTYLCPLKGVLGESCSMFSVLDGHGGVDTAQHCRMLLPHFIVGSTHFPSNIPEALRCGFRTMQDTLAARYKHTHSQSGTTATVAVVYRKRLHVANVGDSQAVLYSGDTSTLGDTSRHSYIQRERSGSVKMLTTATTLTENHHVESVEEQQAVCARGGAVYEVRGVMRVEGRCRVTRDLGMIELQSLGHTPSVTSRDLTSSDSTLVLATDGLWDVVSPEEVRDLIAGTTGAESLRCSSTTTSTSFKWGDVTSTNSLPASNQQASSCSSLTTRSTCNPCTDVARRLLCEALHRGTKDNCGIIVLNLTSFLQ